MDFYDSPSLIDRAGKKRWVAEKRRKHTSLVLSWRIDGDFSLTYVLEDNCLARLRFIIDTIN